VFQFLFNRSFLSPVVSVLAVSGTGGLARATTETTTPSSGTTTAASIAGRTRKNHALHLETVRGKKVLGIGLVLAPQRSRGFLQDHGLNGGYVCYGFNNEKVPVLSTL
jgi:hypothetical protein